MCLKSPSHRNAGAQCLAGFLAWTRRSGGSGLVPLAQGLHVVIKGLAGSAPPVPVLLSLTQHHMTHQFVNNGRALFWGW